ncbi:MAG: hypothetical protein ACLGI6_08485 [Gammaproteobacteria bacterium]
MPLTSALRLTVASTLLLALLPGCSRQTAEEKGIELATSKIDMAKGIGETMEKKGEAAGEAVFGGIGTVLRGAEKGIEKNGRQIAADASLAAAGLSVPTVNIAGVGEKGKNHGFDVYVLADKPAKGTLRAIAYNVAGKEMGRAKVDIQRDADDAKYTLMQFEEQVELSNVHKLAFQFKPDATVASK